MRLPRLSTQHITYVDYARWGDEQRWELIDGPTYAVAQVGTVVQPDVFETSGETTCLTLPQVRIDWARVIDRATPVY